MPITTHFFFFLLWRCDPTRVMASSFLRFLDYTQRRTTLGRTPLDEWSARRRDLYLTTHNTHNRQISMPPVGFETTISAGERPQTYSLDRAATGTGFSEYIASNNWAKKKNRQEFMCCEVSVVYFMCCEVSVVYFSVLTQNLPVGVKESHQNSQSG